MRSGESALPNDIASRIAADFPHEPLDVVLSILEDYQGAERNRVVRSIVFLANGHVDELLELLVAARTDYRDVVFRAEYDRNDKQIHHFDLPFDNTTSAEVWEWASDNAARWLTTRREEDMDRLSFDGSSREQSWTPPEVEWILDGPGDARRDITDCPNMIPGAPILSARAVTALGQQLKGAAELLPLSHGAHAYFALNVINVIDALDEAQCDLERFGSTGRIMRVRAYAFLEESLGQHTVFKDRRLARTTVFVTSPFASAVAEAKLTGFVFRRVWASDGRRLAASASGVGGR